MTFSPNIIPTYEEIANTINEGKHALVWTKIVSDMETPVSAMRKLIKKGEASFLLESVHGGEMRGRYSLLGLYPDRIWRCHKNKAQYCNLEESTAFHPIEGNVMESLNEEIASISMELPEHIPSLAAGLIGYFGYDMIKHIEPVAHQNPDIINIPDACLMRPRLTLIFDAVDGVLYACSPIWQKEKNDVQASYDTAVALITDTLHAMQHTPIQEHYFDPDLYAPLDFTSNMTREAYHHMVHKAQEYIKAGDIFQVVPSQRFTADFDAHPFHLYRALRYRNPSPFLFYLNMQDFSLVGSSPEILVRLRDDIVTIRPIAGTRVRGNTAQEDDALAKELLTDEKEIAEHLMLLDLGRNDVGRAAAHGTVKVTEHMTIERYSHVMHIVSNVEGKKHPTASAIDCLMSGFPAGTVSGAPKIRAMNIIDELEPCTRSFYAGAVGYFSASGWMDTCITLRTALIKDGKIHVQAGGGVVADSDAEAEYQESCNKAKAVQSAAALATQLKGNAP